MKVTRKAKNNISHIVILLVIYLVAVIAFSFFTANKGTTDLTAELSEPTYPVVSFNFSSMDINETYGYAIEMNESYMRDAITLVGDDRKIAINIDTYGNDIEEIYYQVHSMDGERLLEDNVISNYKESGGTISTEITLQNIMDEGTEYVFSIRLSTENNTYYYYTRILKRDSTEIKELLSFVKSFHEETFNKQSSSVIIDHIETDRSIASDTLAYVDINSTSSMIQWGDLDPTIVSDERYYIAEISDYYAALKVEYIVSAKDESGTLRYYDVTEYYRLRNGENQVYLLDFERSMEQIFLGKDTVFNENYLEIGITDTMTEFMGSQSGNIVAFVQEGDLWLYDEEEAEIVRVYSFRGDDFSDPRETSTDHEIRILSIDESGTVEFVVYGYMSRGDHEGEVGIGVYRYTRDDNVVEEELFVPSNKAASVTEQDTRGLFYVNSKNVFYMMINGTLYSIDMETQSVNVLREGLDADTFLVSESGQHIAWISEEEVDSSTCINVMDLETETVELVRAGDDKYVKPLAYLQEDFVYGIAKDTDLVVDAAGNTFFIMSEIVILDEDLEEIKTYSSSGYYTISAYVEDEVLHLNRVMRSEEGYVDAPEDTIINYSLSETDYNHLLNVSENDQEIVALTVEATISNPNPRLVTTESVVNERVDTVSILKQDEDSDRYFVYKACEAILSTKTLSTAIQKASDEGGTVIGDSQAYIWRRGRGSAITTVKNLDYPESANDAGSIAQCIDTILNYEGVSNNAEYYLDQGFDIYLTMRGVLKDYRVLDLTGCTLEQVLYYVARSTPVLAMVDSENAVLITGYDNYNITVFYPETKETGKISLSDGQSLFESAGSVFVGYLR